MAQISPCPRCGGLRGDRGAQILLSRGEQLLGRGLVRLQVQDPAQILQDASQLQGVGIVGFEFERPIRVLETTCGPLGVKRLVEAGNQVGLAVRQPSPLDRRGGPVGVERLDACQYRIRLV